MGLVGRRSGRVDVTVPVVPSTVTRSPSLIVRVASLTITTAGMANSRATVAAWDSTPPVSTTTAPATTNNGVHGASVNGATRRSPGSTSRAKPASADSMIRAGPVTGPPPADTPSPCSVDVGLVLRRRVTTGSPIQLSGTT